MTTFETVSIGESVRRSDSPGLLAGVVPPSVIFVSPLELEPELVFELEPESVPQANSSVLNSEARTSCNKIRRINPISNVVDTLIRQFATGCTRCR